MARSRHHEATNEGITYGHSSKLPASSGSNNRRNTPASEGALMATSLLPIIDRTAPHAPANTDIWVIASYFNPEGYQTKRYDIELFRNNLERQSVPYTIVECAFQGRPFQLPLDCHVLRIRASDIMWQKERLLNCALEAVPALVSKVAWLDSDVIFEDDDWYHKASVALDRFSVIQPFDWSVRLPPGHFRYAGQGRVSPSFASVAVRIPKHLRSNYSDHGRTGFAWAARRSCFGLSGLYDGCIMGGADHLMAHVFDFDLGAPCLREFWPNNSAFKRHFESWARSIQGHIEQGDWG